MLTTKFNDSLILITIISCDYLNLSLAIEYVGDVIIPTRVIKIVSKRISQSDCSIQIKLNYILILILRMPFLNTCLQSNSLLNIKKNMVVEENFP